MSPHLAHRMFLLWIAALAAGFLLLLPKPAHGVGMAWNAFAGTPESSREIDLACTSGGFHELVVDFAVPETLANINVLEVGILIGKFQGLGEPPPPPLPPFWHFESGGCNQNGSTVSLEMPADPAGRENPWGFHSGAAAAYVAYTPDSPSAGRGRFVVQVVRSTPTTLVPGQRYFAFRLILNTCDADACSGCEMSGGIALTGATLGEPNRQVHLLDPFADGDYPTVCMNSAAWCGFSALTGTILSAEVPPGSGLDAAFQPVRHVENICAPTPVRASTWGSIKTLYR